MKSNVIFLVTSLVLGCRGDKSISINSHLKEPEHADIITQSEDLSHQSPNTLSDTVLLAGDSLMVGMVSEFQRIIGACGYKTVSHAVVGTSSLQWLGWMKHDLEEHHPALVIISLGTNDAAGLDNVLRLESLQNLVFLLDASRIPYVWILPHGIDRARIHDIDSVRDTIRSLAKRSYDSPVLNLRVGVDGVHLSNTEYIRWSREVWLWSISMGIVSCITGPQTTPQ